MLLLSPRSITVLPPTFVGVAQHIVEVLDAAKLSRSMVSAPPPPWLWVVKSVMLYWPLLTSF